MGFKFLELMYNIEVPRITLITRYMYNWYILNNLAPRPAQIFIQAI